MIKSSRPRPLSPAQHTALESAADGGGLRWVKPNTRRWLAERELIFARGIHYNEWKISSKGLAALTWGHYGEVAMPDGTPVTLPALAGGRQTIASIGEAENLLVEVSALIWRETLREDTASPFAPAAHLFPERRDVLTEVIQRTLRLDLKAFLERYDKPISAACRELHNRMVERGEHPLIPAPVTRGEGAI